MVSLSNCQQILVARLVPARAMDGLVLRVVPSEGGYRLCSRVTGGCWRRSGSGWRVALVTQRPGYKEWGRKVGSLPGSLGEEPAQ